MRSSSFSTTVYIGDIGDLGCVVNAAWDVTRGHNILLKVVAFKVQKSNSLYRAHGERQVKMSGA